MRAKSCHPCKCVALGDAPWRQSELAYTALAPVCVSLQHHGARDRRIEGKNRGRQRLRLREWKEDKDGEREKERKLEA